jgi:hypothetical protein
MDLRGDADPTLKQNELKQQSVVFNLERGYGLKK